MHCESKNIDNNNINKDNNNSIKLSLVHAQRHSSDCDTVRVIISKYGDVVHRTSFRASVEEGSNIINIYSVW